MKKWIFRSVVAFIGFVLLLVAALSGYKSYIEWSYAKKGQARAEAIRAFYLSEARVYLYSLESTRKTPDEGNTFHGYPIRGSVEITAWDEKAALILSLAKGVSQSLYSRMCFDPHHGLRIVDGERVIDFVICFPCFQVRPFNFNNDEMFTTQGYPFAVYDSILKRHGLPVFERK